jgi:hypothetical protein
VFVVILFFFQFTGEGAFFHLLDCRDKKEYYFIFAFENQQCMSRNKNHLGFMNEFHMVRGLHLGFLVCLQ